MGFVCTDHWDGYRNGSHPTFDKSNMVPSSNNRCGWFYIACYIKRNEEMIMLNAIFWIIVYLLGALVSLVFQKCAGLWGRYGDNDPNEANILGVVLWPAAAVIFVICLGAVQLNRLSNVIVSKVCPSAKN